MKKGRSIKQTLDILIKIIFSFSVVFFLYFTCEFVDSFAYNYFVFPLIAITIIFVCGINVGRSLEKLKTNEQIGFFTRKNKSNDNQVMSNEKTEFIVKDTYRIVSNKKILKEVEDGNKIHIKVFNYNDIESE